MITSAIGAVKAFGQILGGVSRILGERRTSATHGREPIVWTQGMAVRALQLGLTSGDRLGASGSIECNDFLVSYSSGLSQRLPPLPSAAHPSTAPSSERI
jgi:hypothetical protein